MASEPTSTFTAEQASVVTRLATALTFLAPLLLLLGAIRLVLGVVVMATSSLHGFWILPEGLLLAFAGLALLAGATDANFLHDVKGREKEHLTHTFQSVNAAFFALLILGCYIAVVAFFSLFV